MNRRTFLQQCARTTAAAAMPGVLSSLCRTASGAETAKRPNLILIVSDDQGWCDLGCQPYHNMPIATPNIDRIAQNGALFTDAYASAPICSPSRAAMLSCRYNQRLGYYDNWEAQVGFHPDEMIVPRYLKPLGYRSAAIGKWHLGWFEHNHPRAMGFDYHYGFVGGMHDYFCADQGETWEGGPFDCNFMELNGKRLDADELDYMPDNLTDHAIDFMKQSSDDPFFLYLAYTTPHGPHQAKPEDLARYENDPDVPDKHRKVVRAMYDALDHNVGRVLDYLEANDLAENTIVAYIADNGGLRPQAGCDNGPLLGSKGYLSEGGIRTCCVVQWPGMIPAGTVYREPIINFDLTSTMLHAAGVDTKRHNEVEGVDLVPYLQNKTADTPHETLHWQMHSTSMDRWAIREGDWKLVKCRNVEGLFNLKDDIGEQHDLSDEYPEIVARLKRKHLAWHENNSPSRVNDDTRRVHIWELRFRKDFGQAQGGQAMDYYNKKGVKGHGDADRSSDRATGKQLGWQ